MKTCIVCAILLYIVKVIIAKFWRNFIIICHYEIIICTCSYKHENYNYIIYFIKFSAKFINFFVIIKFENK